MSKESVYEVENNEIVHKTMIGMRVIVVKGIGYVLVGKNIPSPDVMMRMGFVIAEQIEEGNII